MKKTFISISLITVVLFTFTNNSYAELLSVSYGIPVNYEITDFDGEGDWETDATEIKAEVILASEISKCISEAEAESLESFYLEILAKPGYKNPKTIITIDT